MSHFDYECSKKIAVQDWPFYALIMAAMRQADTDNLVGLEMLFPKVARELHERYNAPGGVIEGDET